MMIMMMMMISCMFGENGLLFNVPSTRSLKTLRFTVTDQKCLKTRNTHSCNGPCVRNGIPLVFVYNSLGKFSLFFLIFIGNPKVHRLANVRICSVVTNGR